MYEKKKESLASYRTFFGRILVNLGVAVMMGAVSLVVGILGYHWLAGLNWVDSFLNASMILSGMGPVHPMPTDAAKIFSACYALFGGVVFVAAAGVVIGPIFHRILHQFHLDEFGEEG